MPASILASQQPDFREFPGALFANNEQGVWFDPSDRSTLFQDVAGTTPVTTPGQTVARINDKSGRGNHATQATSSLRPAYQIDGTGRPFLLFDGVDDFLATGTITPGTDKGQMIVGARVLASSAGVLAGLGVPNSLGTLNAYYDAEGYGANSVGTLWQNAALVVGYVPPVTSIICAHSDISGPNLTLRVDGEQKVQNNGNQGAGDFGVHTLTVGLFGSFWPFNGRIYGLITRFGPNLPENLISAAETWMNVKTGAY